MVTLTCAEADDLAGGFVLGALEAGEMAAVRAHLGSCAEPHHAFEELGGAVPYLAASLEPIEPAAAVRGRLIAAVRAEGGVDRASSSTPDERTRTWRRLFGGSRTWLGIGLAGAAVAVVLLVASTLDLSNRLNDTQAYADHLAQVAALSAAPGSRAVVLSASADGGAPNVEGIAVLPATGQGLLVAKGLPPTTGSQVYEVWLIEGSAAPSPAGAFRIGSSGQGWVEGIPSSTSASVVVALTREPGPGATKPTLPILASGTPPG